MHSANSERPSKGALHPIQESAQTAQAVSEIYIYIYIVLVSMEHAFGRVLNPLGACQAIKDEPITWILVIFYIYIYIYFFFEGRRG